MRQIPRPVLQRGLPPARPLGPRLVRPSAVSRRVEGVGCVVGRRRRRDRRPGRRRAVGSAAGSGRRALRRTRRRLPAGGCGPGRRRHVRQVFGHRGQARDGAANHATHESAHGARGRPVHGPPRAAFGRFVIGVGRRRFRLGSRRDRPPRRERTDRRRPPSALDGQQPLEGDRRHEIRSRAGSARRRRIGRGWRLGSGRFGFGAAPKGSSLARCGGRLGGGDGVGVSGREGIGFGGGLGRSDRFAARRQRPAPCGASAAPAATAAAWRARVAARRACRCPAAFRCRSTSTSRRSCCS